MSEDTANSGVGDVGIVANNTYSVNYNTKSAFGKFIAVEPMKDTGVKSEKKSGVAFLAQKTSLVRLQVIFGNNSIPTGYFIYVTGDSFKQHWANKVFTLDGVDFILVPEEAVQLIEYNNYTPFSYVTPKYTPLSNIHVYGAGDVGHFPSK